MSIFMGNRLTFGSRNYLKVIYEVSDEKAIEYSKLIKEVFEYVAQHVEIMDQFGWEEWGSQISRNINIGDLPYRLVKQLWLKSCDYVDALKLIGEDHE